MKKLFFPKNGLGFFHLTEGSREITQTPEYILETFDDTYQVERRPLEMLMLTNARKLGVNVHQGAEVITASIETSHGCSALTYKIEENEYPVHCKLIADASGPAKILANKFKLVERNPSQFQTDAV